MNDEFDFNKRLQVGNDVFILKQMKMSVFEACSLKAKEYNLTWNEVYCAYLDYIKRKSILDEEKQRKFVLNNNKKEKKSYYAYDETIIKLIIDAQSDNDLLDIINRYEWNVIKDSVDEYCDLHYTSDDNILIIKNNINKMRDLQYKKEVKKEVNNFKKISDVINEYLNSNDVFIDFIAGHYYKTMQGFKSDLERLKGHEEYDKYFLAKQERFSKFLKAANHLLENYENKNLSSLDISLFTGLSLNKFINSLRKKVVVDKLGISRRTLTEFINYININFSKHKLSKDEALNFVYAYNGESIKPYLNEIINFLEAKDIDLTRSNIEDAFKRALNNKKNKTI